MQPKINTKVLMFGAWANLYYGALLGIGWALTAGFVPPISPMLNAEEIAQLFSDDLFRIRLGMIISMFGAMMFLFLSATAAYFISRIEGWFGPLSVLQVMGGVCGAILTFYPPAWWLTATFRPDRLPEILWMLSDAAWLQWVGALTIYLPFLVSLIVAAFVDDSEEPVFPRWLGYYLSWVLIMETPVILIFFFYEGPFAWDGLFGFWIPFAVYVTIFLNLFYFCRKAVLRIERG